MSEESYQQSKVYSLFIGLKEGKSKHVGYINVKEGLPSGDFAFVEQLLWNLFTAEQRFEFGKFYVVAELKRGSDFTGDLSSLIEEEVETVKEDAPF